jgi:GT2 family glycosyltransferase
MTTLEVIILNWNGWHDTEPCLDSLLSTDPKIISLTVVDNGSSDADVQYIATKYGKRVRIVESAERLGFSAANNLALVHSSATYCLLLNNDTTVPSGTLEGLITAMDEDPTIGVSGPVIYHYSRDEIQSAGSHLSLTTGDASLSTRVLGVAPYSVDMVSGCCFLIRSALVQKIGGLDEEYGYYYEESDYCLKAVKAGYTVKLIPGSSIKHKGGATTSRTNGFAEYQLARNRFLLLKKNGTSLQQLSTLAYVSLFYIWARSARIIFTKQTASLGSFWRGYIAGLGLLFHHPE